MSNDATVLQARYALLNANTNRKTCLLRNRFLLVGLLLVVVTFLILALYVATVGIYNQVLFPRNTGRKDVPKHWVNRAIFYNSIDYDVVNKTRKLLYKKAPNVTDFKLVCYYSFPSEKSVLENMSGVLLPDTIDPNLCTHINLAFASVANNSIYLSNFQLDVARKVIGLKKVNKNLKVLLSVGGADNAKGYPEMVLSHESRKMFIKSIDFYIRQYKFDGVDLDWEFPNNQPGKDKKQKVHFTQLLHEIRNEINRQDRHKFLLSVAVAAPVFFVDLCYDVSYMNEYVDYINLMSYDYHFYTKFTPFTGLNAPLYSVPNEDGYFATLNINYSANYWHVQGMDKSKIIVGLPTYGHSFKLLNPNNNGLGAPAKGYGNLGSIGFIDFSDVCWFLNKNQITPVFDLDTKSLYATKYTEWISYDDQISLTFKAEYVKNNNFGGAMVLSLNADDHQGYCKSDGKSVRFPLTNRVRTILNDQQL